MILLMKSDLTLWKDRETCGHNSIGRVSAFQAECYEFKPRCPLHYNDTLERQGIWEIGESGYHATLLRLYFRFKS